MNGPEDPQEPPIEPSEPPSGLYTPVEPPSRASRARVTAWILVVLVMLAGSGAALVLRASNTEQSIDRFVPDDVAAYVRVSLKPSGQQRSALRALISRYPSDLQKQFGSKIDDALESIFSEAGLSYAKDVKPWVGGQVAFAVRGSGGAKTDAPSAEPTFVLLLSVKDASAANKALTKVQKDHPDLGAFHIAGGVAYLSDTADHITAFRNALNDGHPLADLPRYKQELSRAGGEGLLFAYADLSKLGGIASVLPGDILGGGGSGTGIVAASLKAEEAGFVLSGHSAITTKQSLKTGQPKLLESAPADGLGSLSIFDLGGVLQSVLKSLKQLQSFGSISPVSQHTGQEAPFSPPVVVEGVKGLEKLLGLSIEKDLVPWLRGEFSVVVGQVVEPPIPDIGIMISPTDGAALGRTMRALRTHLGSLLQGAGRLVPRTDGFDITTPIDLTVVVRTTSDRVVIATSPRYANVLLRAASAPLADDSVYRVAIDRTKPTSFQMFLRLDRIRLLAEAFAKLGDPNGYASYEKDVQPFLKPLQAFSLQASGDDKEQEFRLVITLAK